MEWEKPIALTLSLLNKPSPFTKIKSKKYYFLLGTSSLCKISPNLNSYK